MASDGPIVEEITSKPAPVGDAEGQAGERGQQGEDVGHAAAQSEAGDCPNEANLAGADMTAADTKAGGEGRKFVRSASEADLDTVKKKVDGSGSKFGLRSATSAAMVSTGRESGGGSSDIAVGRASDDNSVAAGTEDEAAARIQAHYRGKIARTKVYENTMMRASSLSMHLAEAPGVQADSAMDGGGARASVAAADAQAAEAPPETEANLAGADMTAADTKAGGEGRKSVRSASEADLDTVKKKVDGRGSKFGLRSATSAAMVSTGRESGGGSSDIAVGRASDDNSVAAGTEAPGVQADSAMDGGGARASVAAADAQAAEAPPETEEEDEKLYVRNADLLISAQSRLGAITTELSLADKALADRRSTLGGDDGVGRHEDAATVALTPKETLIRRAKVYMLSTGCTRWDETAKRYIYLPILRTRREQLHMYGLGVTLYFDFLCHMSLIFLVMSILAIPQMATCLMGDLVLTASTSMLGTVNSFIAMPSIGNLGTCGENNVDCPTTEALRNRRIANWIDTDSSTVGSWSRVKDWTLAFGVLDALGLLVFLGYGAWFQNYWFRHRRKIDKRATSVRDFAVRIERLPRKLDRDNHRAYADLLKRHLTAVVSKSGVNISEGEAVIDDVVLVRQQYGAFGARMAQGKLVGEKFNRQVLLEKAKNERQPKGKLAKLQKGIDNINKNIANLEDSFAEAKGTNDEEKPVVSAFVVFNRARYRKALLHEYRYSHMALTRGFQSQELRFHGAAIKVTSAPEPSDLLWENLDVSRARKLTRRIVTTCVMLILFALSLVLLALCESDGTSFTGETPDRPVWVLRGIDPGCFGVCDLQFYTHEDCVSTGTDDVEVETLFDAIGMKGSGYDPRRGVSCFTDGTEPTCAFPGAIACNEGGHLSPACSEDERGGDGEGTQFADESDWVAFRLTTSRQIKCIRFTQPLTHVRRALELYACDGQDVPDAGNASGFAHWKPLEHCVGMQDLHPNANVAVRGATTTGLDRYAEPFNDHYLSGRLLVEGDAMCRRTIVYNVAYGAREKKKAAILANIDSAEVPLWASTWSADRLATWKAGTEDTTVSCFCTNQALDDPKFVLPPFDTDAKKLCQDWVYSRTQTLAMTGLSVGVVLVLNTALVYVCEFMVNWELHASLSEARRSQFVKLFASQVLNTGLILLLVNSNLRIANKDFALIEALKFFKIGAGSFEDFESSWFTAVGAAMFITISCLVVTGVATDIVMVFFVRPLTIFVSSRRTVTQLGYNLLYELPEWQLGQRQAQNLNVMFCIVMYSGGMPILNVVGVLYCVVTYWTDKWVLLRASHQPPKFNGNLMVSSVSLFLLAGFFHTIITLWTFSNQNLMPSEWSWLVGFFEGFVGMTKEDAVAHEETFLTASEEQRDLLGMNFLRARILNFARNASWMLLAIFLIFLVSAATTVLLVVLGDVLRHVFKPCWIACRACLGYKPIAKHGKSLSDVIAVMIKSNAVTGYRIEGNPRYAKILESLREQPEEIQKAIRSATVPIK